MKTTAFEFASLVEKRIEALPADHHHTRPRPAKRLIEEIYPLSRLAVFLKQPGLEVEVQAYENSGQGDGHIWLTGYHTDDFGVEVTFAGYGEEQALRSELLVQQEFVPGAGPIWRDTKTRQIHATMTAQDYFEPIRVLASSVLECNRKKLEKSYAAKTVLIVAFDDARLRGRGWWDLLYTAIKDMGGIERGNFQKVYLFNCCSNELQQVA